METLLMRMDLSNVRLGQDMIEYIYTHANMYTIVYLQKDRSLGLDAEFLHVLLVKARK